MSDNKGRSFWKRDCNGTLRAALMEGGFALAAARITRPGLTAIALLVALLWACALGERFIVRRANIETARTLRDMRSLRMKNRRQPASVPTRPPRHSPRPELG